MIKMVKKEKLSVIWEWNYVSLERGEGLGTNHDILEFAPRSTVKNMTMSTDIQELVLLDLMLAKWLAKWYKACDWNFDVYNTYANCSFVSANQNLN